MKWIVRLWRKIFESLKIEENDRATSAYRQGFDARSEGDDFNPYPVNSANHRRWRLGYEEYENFMAQGW